MPDTLLLIKERVSHNYLHKKMSNEYPNNLAEFSSYDLGFGIFFLPTSAPPWLPLSPDCPRPGAEWVRLLNFHHLFWPAECSLMLFLARFGSYFHFRYGHSHSVAPTGNSFFPDIPLGSLHFHNAIGFHHCSLWFFFLSLLLPSCSVTSRR